MPPTGDRNEMDALCGDPREMIEPYKIGSRTGHVCCFIVIAAAEDEERNESAMHARTEAEQRFNKCAIDWSLGI